MDNPRVEWVNILPAALVVANGEGRGGLAGAVDVLVVLAHDGEAALAVSLNAKSLIIRSESTFELEGPAHLG